MLRLIQTLCLSACVLAVSAPDANAQRGGGRGGRGRGFDQGGFGGGGGGFDQGGFGGRGGFNQGGFGGGGGFNQGGFGGRGGFNQGGFGGGGGGFNQGGFGGRGGGFNQGGFGGGGGGFNQGGFGGGGGGRGGGRGGFDPTALLKQMDINANGVLEPDELQGRARFLIERFAQGANLDLEKPIPLAKLQEAIQQTRQAQTNGDSSGVPPPTAPASNTPTTKPSDKSDAPATIQGFGAEFESVHVPGFGETPAVASLASLINTASPGTPPQITNTASSSAPGRDGRGRFDRDQREWSSSDEPTADAAPAAESAPAPSNGDLTAKIAKGLLDKYDTNKDGTLQKDEWSQMSNEPEKADKNNDGQITLAELIERMGGGSTTAPASTPTAEPVAPATTPLIATGETSGRERGGRRDFGSFDSSRARGRSNSSEKPYRFLTPAERLPAGLPSSFTSKDRDRDGQVTMAEFSNTWTESTLAEFNRWDLNRDGFITATECLTAENRRGSR